MPITTRQFPSSSFLTSPHPILDTGIQTHPTTMLSLKNLSSYGFASKHLVCLSSTAATANCGLVHTERVAVCLLHPGSMAVEEKPTLLFTGASKCWGDMPRCTTVQTAKLPKQIWTTTPAQEGVQRELWEQRCEQNKYLIHTQDGEQEKAGQVPKHYAAKEIIQCSHKEQTKHTLDLQNHRNATLLNKHHPKQN